MTPPTLALSFAAGLLSFLSPCIVPLVPSYLSFIGGVAATEARESTAAREAWSSFARFSSSWGSRSSSSSSASPSPARGALSQHRYGHQRDRRGVVILLGLNIIFDFWKFLNIERRVHFEATGRPRRRARHRHGVRRRVDPVHRPDPREHPPPRRNERQRNRPGRSLSSPSRSVWATVPARRDLLRPGGGGPSAYPAVSPGDQGRERRTARRDRDPHRRRPAAAAIGPPHRLGGAALRVGRRAPGAQQRAVRGIGTALVGLLPPRSYSSLGPVKRRRETRVAGSRGGAIAAAALTLAVLNLTDVVSIASWVSGWFQFTGL